MSPQQGMVSPGSAPGGMKGVAMIPQVQTMMPPNVQPMIVDGKMMYYQPQHMGVPYMNMVPGPAVYGQQPMQPMYVQQR